MKFFWISLLFFVLVFLQVTIFSIPLVVGGLLLLSVVSKEYWVFPLAFFMGLFLDILTFHVVGASSLFLVVILGVVFLYERKFEIQSLQFVGVATCIAAFLYGLLFHESYIVLGSVILALLSGGIFFVLEQYVTLGHPQIK